MTVTNEKIYVGVDVSKLNLDVSIQPSGKNFTCSNDSHGYKELIRNLPSSVTLVVFEATGGYEKEAAKTIAAAGIAVAVVNPRQVRDFAKAMGKLAKTDRIDSNIIALFAEKINPRETNLGDKKLQQLSDMRGRRRQLVNMITMEKNRLSTAGKSVNNSIKKTIAFLEKELEKLDGKLKTYIENDKDLSKKDPCVFALRNFRTSNVLQKLRLLDNLVLMPRPSCVRQIRYAQMALHSDFTSFTFQFSSTSGSSAR